MLYSVCTLETLTGRANMGTIMKACDIRVDAQFDQRRHDQDLDGDNTIRPSTHKAYIVINEFSVTASTSN